MKLAHGAGERMEKRTAWLRAGAASGLLAAAVWAAPLALAREGVDVGANSAFSKLVPAQQVEASAAQQYLQTLQEARAKQALAPGSHPQVRRLRLIAQRIIPFANEWNPRARDWKWEVNLIGSDQVNAYCMPGGKVMVNAGITADRDGRRFHLWEATPLQYLERLHLQNMLVPGLNSLEGVIDQPDDLAIVISQPRFEIIPVTEEEIIAWFALQGFAKVTASGYYRAEDNLGVFDAHDKNVVRFENDLIPFDVIPVRPDGGFLSFIEDTLGAGHEVREVRTVNRGT